MEIKQFEEVERWLDGKSENSTKQYKKTLEKFCEFHELDPKELVLEARNFEPEDPERAHLEENPADKRLKKFYSHLMEKDVAKTSAQTYWRQIQSFYQNFGVDITVETPKAPDRVNGQPEFAAADIKEMVMAARTARNQAIILVAFQAGIDPQEICRLDYRHVKPAVENDQWPYFMEKTRKKTKVRHHAPLLKDGVKALQRYLNQRSDIDADDPLFVKKTGERIEPDTIRFIMRKIRDRAIDQIPEAQNVESEINPLAPKYLRKAFGIACENAGVNRIFKEYWLGHADSQYNGAYSGQITKQKQKEELEKVKPLLTTSTPKEELEEKEAKQDERLNRLQKKIAEEREKRAALEEKLEKYKEELSETMGMAIMETLESHTVGKSYDEERGEIRELDEAGEEFLTTLVDKLKEKQQENADTS